MAASSDVKRANGRPVLELKPHHITDKWPEEDCKELIRLYNSGMAMSVINRTPPFTNRTKGQLAGKVDRMAGNYRERPDRISLGKSTTIPHHVDSYIRQHELHIPDHYRYKTCQYEGCDAPTGTHRSWCNTHRDIVFLPKDDALYSRREKKSVVNNLKRRFNAR